jgi:uncharacterized protein (TIGR03437 family)
VAANPPLVAFSGGIAGTTEEVTPAFAGLSGGSAGLYQVTVAVPADMPKGPASVRLDIPNWTSNWLPLVVQ